MGPPVLMVTICRNFCLAVLAFGFSFSLCAKDETSSLLSAERDLLLQTQMETMLRRQGLWNAVQRGELSLLLAIVTEPDKPRLAEVNGHEMMYAASLPKIAIMLGAAVAIEEGRLKLNQSLHDDFVNMIRYSCNACATRVLELVGRENLIDLLESPEYDFYDPKGEGGLWVGKDYGPSPAYHRDPVANLSHGATAFQVARFYYRLNAGTLVSPEYNALMMEALSNPGIDHKFVKGLRGVKGLDIRRKSGSWRNYHADSALINYRNETYIIVGLTNNPKGGQWLAQLALPLNDLVRSQKLWPTVAHQSP